jgi:autotransporter-associated beta strand protein
MMHPPSRLLSPLTASGALTLLTLSMLPAADGTWTQVTTPGNWGTAANWLDNAITDGSDATAFFDTLELVEDQTIHLDAPRSLAALNFGDTDPGTPAGWLLDNNGNAANLLTLDGTSPTIIVPALGTGKNTTISAALGGTAGLTKSGAGSLVLSAANPYSGLTQINGGNLTVANAAALGGNADGTAIQGPATLFLADGITVSGENLTMRGSTSTLQKPTGTGTSGWAGNITLNGNSNSGQYVRADAGTLVIGSNRTHLLTNNSNILFLRGNGTYLINSTLTGSNSSSGTNAGFLRQFASNGTVFLTSPNNSFTGDVNIWQGIMDIASVANTGVNSPLGSAGVISLGNGTSGGNLRFSGPAGGSTDRVLDLTGATGGGTLEMAGSGLLRYASDLRISGNGTKNLTLQGSTTGTGEFAGVIPDGTGITGVAKNGTGTWTLSNAANSFSGNVTITNGTLIAATSNSLGSSVGGTNISNGNGTLELASGVTISGERLTAIGALSYKATAGDAKWAGDIELNNGAIIRASGTNATPNTLILGDSEATILTANIAGNGLQLRGTGGLTILSTISGTIAGTNGLWLNGEYGVRTIQSTNNSFNGPITIGRGTLQVASLADAGLNSSLGAGSEAIRISTDTGSGTLKFIGPAGSTTNRVIDLLSTTGAAYIEQAGAAGLLKFTSDFTATGAGAKTLFLRGSAAGTGEIAGRIADNSTTHRTALTKEGTGTWTLSGANSYTGATLVSAGTLALTGSSQSPTITVAAGASLGFLPGTTATADGTVIFNAGGRVRLTSAPSLSSYTLLTAAAITGTPELFPAVPGYILEVVGGTTLKLTSTGSGYTTWANANVGGQGVALDFDQDGIANGIEFFMGTATPGFTPPGVLLNNTITWPKDPAFIGSYLVQTSPDLADWSNADGVMDLGSTVVCRIPSGPGKRFFRLKVSPSP